jgi:hypothetical protein
MTSTVIQHVLERLKAIGIVDIFGVPGDYSRWHLAQQRPRRLEFRFGGPLQSSVNLLTRHGAPPR